MSSKSVKLLIHYTHDAISHHLKLLFFEYLFHFNVINFLSVFLNFVFEFFSVVKCFLVEEVVTNDILHVSLCFLFFLLLDELNCVFHLIKINLPLVLQFSKIVFKLINNIVNLCLIIKYLFLVRCYKGSYRSNIRILSRLSIDTIWFSFSLIARKVF